MNHKLLLITIVVIATMLCGCTAKMSTYVHEEHPSEYIELYADNRYAVVTDAGFCGTWRIHDENIHLYFDDALIHILEYDCDGIYIDHDGDRWVQK